MSATPSAFLAPALPTRLSARTRPCLRACTASAPLPRARALSRRGALQLAIAAAAGAALAPRAASARRKPRVPLVAALVPLVRTRDALGDLAEDIEAGTTNRNLGQVMRVLLRGNDLAGSVKEGVLWLSPREAEDAVVQGREAIEFLDQTLAYFDPVALDEKPVGEYLAFALKAIDAAGRKLDAMLAHFPAEEVANARQQVTMTFPPS